MTVSRLQNVHFVASSVPELAEFWQQALGMELGFADGERWIQLKAGDDSFAIASVGEGVADQVGAVPVFEVDGFTEHVSAIKAHGGQVLDERDMGSHGRVLSFRDPEGNIAQLFTRNN